jgi:S-adenosylmethionine-diacylglycerol 3-amino-3-carboxypropyl transferase
LFWWTYGCRKTEVRARYNTRLLIRGSHGFAVDRGRGAEADLAALQLLLGSTIVTISSGGCNALSYLTAQPAQVLISTRPISPSLSSSLPAFAFSPAIPIFDGFLGKLPLPPTCRFAGTGCSRCSTHKCGRTGDKRNAVGRPRYAHFGNGFYRHGMVGRIIGLAHVAAKLARIDLGALLGPTTSIIRSALRRWIASIAYPFSLVRLITRTPALLLVSAFRRGSAHC